MTAFDAIAALDLATVQRCNRINRRAWGRLFAWASRLGDGVFWYALMLALLLAEGAAAVPTVLLMLACGIAGAMLYKGLKLNTRRPRPCDVEGSLTLTVAPLDRFSFPSGHTLHAVCFAVLATAHLPMLGWIAIPFAVLVAGSRMVLGLHYPSDVAVGGVIGALIAASGLAAAAGLGIPA
jgi:undecaprenyl-diphosphatase